MKQIIFFAGFSIVLAGCGDSTRFSSSSSEKNPSPSRQNSLKKSEALDASPSDSQDFDSTEAGENHASDESKAPIEPTFEEEFASDTNTEAKTPQTEKTSDLPQSDKAPGTITQTPNESQVPKAPTPAKSPAEVATDEMTLRISEMVTTKGTNLTGPQRQLMAEGLTEVGKTMLAGPANIGAGLNQIIDLTKKVNALKGNAFGALPIDLPLPVDLPAVIDAAALQDLAAALGDLGAAAVALDLAGIMAALQDILALIMDLIA